MNEMNKQHTLVFEFGHNIPIRKKLKRLGRAPLRNFNEQLFTCFDFLLTRGSKHPQRSIGPVLVAKMRKYVHCFVQNMYYI